MIRQVAESGAATDFDSWVAPHLGVLRRMASLYAGRSDREDLIQETLSRAWIRRLDFDPARGSANAWLCAILIDRARKSWRRTQPQLAANGELPTTAVPDTGADASLDIRRAVARLPRRQREVIVLHYYADLSIADTAELLRCSAGTVKSQLFDARKRLEKELDNYGE